MTNSTSQRRFRRLRKHDRRSPRCAPPAGAMTSPGQSVDRDAVSPLELFFDVGLVFAVSQLSHHLLDHLSWRGAAWTALLRWSTNRPRSQASTRGAARRCPYGARTGSKCSRVAAPDPERSAAHSSATTARSAPLAGSAPPMASRLRTLATRRRRSTAASSAVTGAVHNWKSPTRGVRG